MGVMRICVLLLVLVGDQVDLEVSLAAPQFSGFAQ